jgi:hypothetical protein
MDPVSALGFAATIVQFVTFTSKILTSATEIRHAPTGVSAEIQSIDEIYSTLRDIRGRLANGSRKAASCLKASDPIDNPAPDFEKSMRTALGFSDVLDDAAIDPVDMLRRSYSSLNSLLIYCESDCSRITRIVFELKSASRSGSRWDCFRAALKTVWKRDEIARVEEQLERIQRGVMMEMSHISKYSGCPGIKDSRD